MAARRDDAVSEALDRLYAAPLDAFMALRRELVASLRARKGDPQAAKAARQVGAAPKPTRTAWALDQVAHRSPQLVRAMLDARDAAAETQKQGEGDAIRAAVREYRMRTTEVTHAARDALLAAGFGVTASQLRRMGETLATASVEGSDARSRLAAGWLTEDVGQEDPFAGIEAGPAGAQTPPREGAPAREDPARVGAAAAARAKAEAAGKEKAEAAAREKSQHEAARRAAQERVDTLEAEVRDARTEARQRETAALRARDEADRARRVVEEVELRLGTAREALRAMRA